MSHREIKFRVWYTDDKEMDVIEDLYFFEENSIHTIPEDPRRQLDMIFLQFTGLKDKNKKDGYEGDIVKLFDRSLFIIVWDEYYARFQLELADGYDELHKVYAMDMLQFGEIVGNLYEHPHLLKVSGS